MSDPPGWEASVSDGVLRVRVSGAFDMGRWREVLHALPSVEGYRPNLTAIFDARDASFNFSHSEIMSLVSEMERLLENRGKGYRVAYVVGSDLDFGIARMIQLMCDEIPIEATTFRSMEEAERWAKAPPAPER